MYNESGPIPFGYANEQLAAFDPANPRNEDHVGHKVEWENDIVMSAGGGQFQITCDVLTKLHQGTHSKDAFTNDLHELVYHLSCGDGTKFHVVWSPLSASRVSSVAPADGGAADRRVPLRRRIRPRAVASAPFRTASASSSRCSCRTARTRTSAR